MYVLKSKPGVHLQSARAHGCTPCRKTIVECYSTNRKRAGGGLKLVGDVLGELRRRQKVVNLKRISLLMVNKKICPSLTPVIKTAADVGYSSDKGFYLGHVSSVC